MAKYSAHIYLLFTDYPLLNILLDDFIFLKLRNKVEIYKLIVNTNVIGSSHVLQRPFVVTNAHKRILRRNQLRRVQHYQRKSVLML